MASAGSVGWRIPRTKCSNGVVNLTGFSAWLRRFDPPSCVRASLEPSLVVPARGFSDVPSFTSDPARLAARSHARLAGGGLCWVSDVDGFQDDLYYRWLPERQAMRDRARDANATIMKSTVSWYLIAETRPANAANPFDPAYNWSDIDEFVRMANDRDIEVMLTVYGTPSWAGPARNRLPRRLADLQQFARAVATRSPAATRRFRSSASTRCGTSRTCSCSSRRSSPAGVPSAPPCTRSCTGRPTPGSSRDRRRRRSRWGRRRRGS